MFKLTPEIVIESNSFTYLILVDGKNTISCNTKEEAKKAIDSIAKHEISRLTNDCTKVTREDVNSGEKVILYTQVLGQYWNGSITKEMELEIETTPIIKLIVKEDETTPIVEDVKPVVPLLSLPKPLPPTPPPLPPQL